MNSKLKKQMMLATVGLVLLDQLCKQLVAHHLSMYESFSLTFFLNITHVHNLGAAMNLLGEGHPWQIKILLGIEVFGVILLLGWLWLQWTRDQKFLAWGTALMLAGALSNAYDRFTLGYVIDYLSFHLGQWQWPAVVNLADLMISIGLIVYVVAPRIKSLQSSA